MLAPIYNNNGKAWLYLAMLINWGLIEVEDFGDELKQATMLEF